MNQLMYQLKTKFLKTHDLENIEGFTLVNCNLQCLPYQSIVVNLVFRTEDYDIVISGPIDEPDSKVVYLYYTILSNEHVSSARYLKDLFGSIYDDFKNTVDDLVKDKFFSRL